MVRAAGAGTYTVANVQTDLGIDTYAAWGLVVVVHDPSQPARNLTVFDGFADVQPRSSQDISVSGFKAPLAGLVNTRVGVIAYEGDFGLKGDALELAATGTSFTTLSDSANPPDNFMASGISRLGQRVTSKNPDFVNQLGFDAKIVSATGVLPNGATSTTVRLTTKGDIFYPGVVTTAKVQREIVSALERTRTPMVVRFTAPITAAREPNRAGRSSGVTILDRYVAAHYRPVAKYGFYAILERRGA